MLAFNDYRLGLSRSFNKIDSSRPSPLPSANFKPMKVSLYKVKENMYGEWLGWCNKLMTTHKKEALETLKEEGLLFEATSSFSLNGDIYVLSMFEGEEKPTNMERELNKRHMVMRQECLQLVYKNIPMDYQFKV